VEVGHFRAKFTGTFVAHIFQHMAAKDLLKTTSGKSWKHLNYRVTSPAFSA
jgi:hypothetical protein